MKIPKKFKLFSTTINVVFDNQKLINNDSCIGLCESTESLISLADTYKGNKLNSDVIADTYYHEKVHMILDNMREFELSGNEKFVDVFSKLLRQADETSEY